MSAVEFLRPLVRRSPAVRRLARHPLLWRAIRLKRLTSLLRPAVAFVVGELRGGTRRYRVPSGHTLVVRHRSRDIDLVCEILGPPRAYEPPAALDSKLRGPLRILDLGGNIGVFGVFALGRWNVREMTSFEPDPENAALLAKTVVLNRASDRWSVEQAAVSNMSGRMTFLSGHFADSRRAEEGESGIDVSMVDVFALDHSIDLLKIDIEGGEWAILSDRRLGQLPARVIVMEWHWRFAPQDDAHAAAVDLLERAGYQINCDRVDLPFGHTGLVWASRP